MLRLIMKNKKKKTMYIVQEQHLQQLHIFS